MVFQYFSPEMNRYIFSIDSNMTSNKTSFLEANIRKGFTSEDVRLWQALCRQCETDVADSHKWMHFILDMAKHNAEPALQIIHTGRELSGQKAVNQKFIEALVLAVCSDNDDDEDDKAAANILDLTADEDLESGSYEEEEKGFYDDIDDNPTSADAYEIDGFVVADDEPEAEGNRILRKSSKVLEPEEAVRRTELPGLMRSSAFVETPAGAVAVRKSSLKKRVLESISEDEE